MKNIFERARNLKENIEIFGVQGILFSIQDDVENMMDDISGGFDNLISNKNGKDASTSSKARELKAGDIIAVTRKLGYQHFGVYIGNSRVIHFASPEGDWNGGKPIIHEAPFENFLRDANSFEILMFEESRKEPLRFIGLKPVVSSCVGTTPLVMNLGMVPLLCEALKNIKYHVYSPKETVERAKEVAKKCSGEKTPFEVFVNGHRYNLIFNNCEHFAIWCKTGIHESRQVDKVLQVITGMRNHPYRR